MSPEHSSDQPSLIPPPKHNTKLLIIILAVLAIGIVAIVVTIMLVFRQVSTGPLTTTHSNASQSAALAPEYSNYDPDLPFTIQPPAGWKKLIGSPEGVVVEFNIFKKIVMVKPMN